MEKKLILHTRCIPKEHLNLKNVTSKTIINSNLCDCLSDENIEKLKKSGITLIELRYVPYLKKDYLRLKKDIKKLKDSGLKVGIFCWNQYQHNLTSLKLGSPTLALTLLSFTSSIIKKYELCYKNLAKELGDVIDFIYIGVYGDYGEVCFPSGVKHYKFSPAHGHAGLLCNDKFARKKCPISTNSLNGI